MTACPFCTAGLYLNDHPGLGPCVCVTPERVEALELERDGLQEQLDHANTRLTEAWELTSTGTAGSADRSLAEQLAADADGVMEMLGESATVWTTLGDVAQIAGWTVARLPEAADALQRYLVGQGLPAMPLRLDDPDLDALADALLT